MSNPQRPHGLQPSRLLRPWDFPGKSTGVGLHHLIVGDVNYPLASTLETILAKKCTLMHGRILRDTNYRLRTKARWLVKGNLEEKPHKRDSNNHESSVLSLSTSVCLSTCTVLFFFLLINTCFTNSIFVGIFFCKVEGPGSLSLTWCSCHCDPANLWLGTQTLLQAVAGWNG